MKTLILFICLLIGTTFLEAQKEVHIENALVLKNNVSDKSLLVDNAKATKGQPFQLIVRYNDKTSLKSGKGLSPKEWDEIQPGSILAIDGQLAENILTASAVTVESPKGKATFDGIVFKVKGKFYIDGYVLRTDANTSLKMGKKTLADLEEVPEGYRGAGTAEMDEQGQLVIQKATFSEVELNNKDLALLSEVSRSITSPNSSTIVAGGKTWKLVGNDSLQKYVNAVLQKIVPAYATGGNEKPNLQYISYVVEGDSVHSASWPNGLILVNMGMLNTLENEAQLAYVLGRELARITHGHAYAKRKKDAEQNSVKNVAGVVREVRRLPVLGAGGKPSPGVDLEDVATFGSGFIGGKLDRDREVQAGRVALSYVDAAGYNLPVAAQAWESLAKGPVQKRKEENTQNLGVVLFTDDEDDFWESIGNSLNTSRQALQHFQRSTVKMVYLYYGKKDYSKSLVEGEKYRQLVGRP